MNSVVTALVPVQYRCTQAVIFFLSSQTVLSVRLPVRSWYCVETNAFRKTFSPPGGRITHIFEPKKRYKIPTERPSGELLNTRGVKKFPFYRNRSETVPRFAVSYRNRLLWLLTTLSDLERQDPRGPRWVRILVHMIISYHQTAIRFAVLTSDKNNAVSCHTNCWSQDTRRRTNIGLEQRITAPIILSYLTSATFSRRSASAPCEGVYVLHVIIQRKY